MTPKGQTRESWPQCPYSAISKQLEMLFSDSR